MVTRACLSVLKTGEIGLKRVIGRHSEASPATGTKAFCLVSSVGRLAVSSDDARHFSLEARKILLCRVHEENMVVAAEETPAQSPAHGYPSTEPSGGDETVADPHTE